MILKKNSSISKKNLFIVFFVGLVWGLLGTFVMFKLYKPALKIENKVEKEALINNKGTGDMHMKSSSQSWRVEEYTMTTNEVSYTWKVTGFEIRFFKGYCADPNDFGCRLEAMDRLALSSQLSDEVCEKMNDISTKNNCYYMLARQEGDEKLCNNIVNDEVLLNICIDQAKISISNNPNSLEDCMKLPSEDVGICLVNFYNAKQFKIWFDECYTLEKLVEKYKQDNMIALSCWDNAIQYNAYLKQLNKCDTINSMLFPSDKLRQKCKLEYGIQNWCDKLDGSLKTQCQLLEAQRLLNNQF